MKRGSCASLATHPLTGTWYRAIPQQHWATALQTSHTVSIPSRFYEGASANPQFELLYLSENHLVALYEVEALLGTRIAPLSNPRAGPFTLANVAVKLQAVADLTQEVEQVRLETTAQELTGDWWGYRQRSLNHSVTGPTGVAPTQALGASLYAVAGLEGFQTVSARVPTHRNLVVFPQKLQLGSQIITENTATDQRLVIP